MAAGPARAYEYALQYAPPGNFKELVVAGYAIVGKSIVGNCSYTAIVSGSGRDPPTHYVPMPQTCTWDEFGNLLGVASGAPSIPNPLLTRGTQTIYARASAHLYTGSDSALPQGGFVFTFGSHFTWLTSNTSLVLPQVPYSFTVTLGSDGDVPLRVGRVKAATALAATVDNPATKIVINSSSCSGLIAAGSTCSVLLTYSDAGLTSASGLAYDAITVHPVTNAGAPADFVQRITDIVSLPTDN
jgi:hypothetical protein